MWPFKRQRKIIGQRTHSQAREWYRMLLDGEITREEYAKKDMRPIVTPIYKDEIKF